MPRKTWEFRWIVHSLVDLGWCVWTAFKLRDVLLELIGVSHMDPFEVGLPELPKFSVKPHLANHPQRLPNFNPNGKFNPLGLKSSIWSKLPEKGKTNEFWLHFSYVSVQSSLDIENSTLSDHWTLLIWPKMFIFSLWGSSYKSFASKRSACPVQARGALATVVPRGGAPKLSADFFFGAPEDVSN